MREILVIGVIIGIGYVFYKIIVFVFKKIKG